VTAAKAKEPLIKVGPRNARTDPETGLRFYQWKGQEYPSVTSVRNLAGMPIKLANWRTEQVIERVLDERLVLDRMCDDGTDRDAIASWLRKAVSAKRDAAADLGTRVHEAAAEGKAIDKVGDDVAPFLIQYRKWLDDSGIDILLAERQVWNLTEGYAGTFDLIGQFKKTGRIFMIDIKTGKGTYPEHALQLEAYCRAEFVGADDVTDHAATDILQSVDGRAILHLRPEGWSFKIIKPEVTGSLWMAFNDLLGFAMWMHQSPSIDGLLSHTIDSKP
jgi:hypothetical protein